MKINAENNQLMLWLAVINIILTFNLFFLALNDIHLNIYFYCILHVPAEVTYIFMLYYLIKILQFAKEKLYVQMPFFFFLALELVSFIAGILPAYQQTGIIVLGSIGTINIVVTIYLLLMAFQVRHVQLSSTYKIYALCLVLVMAFKFSVPFLWPVINGQSPQVVRFFGLIDLLPLFAILYIIYTTGKLLENARGGATS
jgi:hypothetical protein